MDGIDLGDAVLDLTVDSGPADRELDRFEARLAAEAATFDAITKSMGIKGAENLRQLGSSFDSELARPARDASAVVSDAADDVETSLTRVSAARSKAADDHEATAAREAAAIEALSLAERRYGDALAEASARRDELEDVEQRAATADQAYSTLRGHLTEKGLSEANQRIAALRDEEQARRDSLQNAVDEARALEAATVRARQLREQVFTSGGDDETAQLVDRRIESFTAQIKKVAEGDAAATDLAFLDAVRHRQEQATRLAREAEREAIGSAGPAIYQKEGGEGMVGAPSVAVTDQDAKLLIADLEKMVATRASSSGGAVQGVKGPDGGTRQNPVVMVQEAGQRAGMSPTEAAAGTFAEDSTSSSVADGGHGLTMGEMSISEPSIIRLRDVMREAVANGMADVLPSITAEFRKATSSAMSDTRSFSVEPGRDAAHALYEVGPEGKILVQESNDISALAAAARAREMGWTKNVYSEATGHYPTPGRTSSGQFAPRSGRQYEQDDIYADYPADSSGVPGMGPSRPSPLAFGSGYTAEDQQAIADAFAAAAAARAGGGGDGGKGIDLMSLLWGNHGGGGGGGRFGWGPLGWALGGAMGVGAGLGSIGSFAGFGGEHILTTAGSIVGSGMAAAGGAGLLGAGALGQFAVGGGSDLAVIHSVIADTTTLGEAYNKVTKAVTEYGAGSVQAKEAQHELNEEIKALQGTPGVYAELALAKHGMKADELFDASTSGARVQVASIGNQGLDLGEEYIPKIGRAAEQNLSIINSQLKPLLHWLGGPEGVGIFDILEERFQKNLPTAMDAFDNGIEFVLKTIREASGYTGGLTEKIDLFTKRINSPEGFSKWRDEIGRLIATTRDWATFLHMAGSDIFDIFRNDSQTGTSIIEELTKMLEKAKEWETSTEGRAGLRSIFSVHKEEVLALLHLFGPLASSFSNIYVTLAPPLVKAVTGITEAIVSVLDAIEELGPVGKDVLGGAFVAWKLGVLGPAIGGVRGQIRGLMEDLGLLSAREATVAETSMAEFTAALRAQGIMAGVDAGGLEAAGLGAAGSLGGGKVILPAGVSAGEEAAAGEGGLGSLLTGSTLMKAGVLGLIGSMGGELAANAVGAKGSDKSALTMAGAGAGIGATIGSVIPGVGTLLGGAAGAAFAGSMPYAGKLLASIFGEKTQEDVGKRFSSGVLMPGQGMLTERTERGLQERLIADRQRVASTRGIYDEELAANRARGESSPSAQVRREEAPAFNTAFNAEYKEGRDTAGAVIAQYDGVAKKTSASFIADVLTPLHQMSGEARKAGASAMVEYAAELEHKGSLPKGAVHSVLMAMESEFPGLVEYFRSHALGASAAVAEAMKLREAKAALGQSLQNLRAEWGLFNVDPKVTGADWAANTKVAMQDLRSIISSTTGTVKKEAEQHLQELTHNASDTLGLLVSSTDKNMAHLAGAIGAHIPGAKEKLEHEFTDLRSAIVSSVESGTISAAKGAELIGQSLNKALVALGGKPLPTISLKVEGAVSEAAGKVGNAIGKVFAGGGLMTIGNPNAAGYDDVPLNVGGQDIVVGEGEQVAVFNRHQLPIVNAALGPIGGLEGLFSTVTTPHYMASGGLLGKMVAEANLINSEHYPYLWGGGHNNSFAGPYDCSGAVSAILHSAGLISRPEVSGELASFGAPGPGKVSIFANPVHAFMSIDGRFFGTHGEDGAGWYQGSALPGFTVRHVPLSPGETLGGIIAPSVSGSGAISGMVKSGLAGLATQANKYIAGHSFGSPTGAAPGGAHGGYSKAALEHLWVAAGGPSSVAHLMASIALAESGGNPQALNPSGASGLWQVMMPLHSNIVHGSVFDPLVNARAAVDIYKTQGLGAWETYDTGAYRKFMARGGLMFAKGGPVAHGAKTTKAALSEYKREHPKGAIKVKHPTKAGKLSVGSLTESLSEIPGMSHDSHLLNVGTDSFNAYDSEFGLLGEMASNPASLMPEDMAMLGPLMSSTGVNLMPGMLIPAAERAVSRQEVTSGETEPLSELSSLLGYIGGLDTHRLINAAQTGILHAPGFLPFAAGVSVFGAELQILKLMKHAQERVGHIQKIEAELASRFIARRLIRRKRLESLLKSSFARYKAIKSRMERVRLSSAERKLAQEEARTAGQAHLDELQATLTEERGLPKYEQNKALISGLETQMAQIRLHNDQVAKASSATVVEQQLKMQMHPFEEQMHALGGDSTNIGKSGQIGEVVKQLNTLEKGHRELSEKATESRTGTLPKLALQISSLEAELQESRESVRPPHVNQTSSQSEDELKESLLKEQLAQSQLSLAVSQAQYGVLAKLPAYGGSFAIGGVVPGLPGTPTLIEAHGGEKVSKLGEATDTITVIVEDGAVDSKKIKVIANGEAQKVVRKVGKGTNRTLPGRGGGI